MKCPRYQKFISDCLDGNISQKNKKRLELHLKKCPVCNEYFETLKVIDREARHLPEIEIGNISEFEASLRSGLNQIAREKIRKKSKSWLKIPAPAWAIGLVFLATVIYLIFFPRPAEDEQIELATMLSYEDSYLILTQSIATDEEIIDVLNQEIINDIVRETLTWEPNEVYYSEPYQEQINIVNIEEILQIENMSFQEGK